MHEIEQKALGEMFMGSIKTCQGERTELANLHLVSKNVDQSKMWMEMLKLNNKMLQLRLDTGAECNVMTWHLLKLICWVITFSVRKIEPKGKANPKCDYKDKTLNLNPARISNHRGKAHQLS